jgi:hypothetical protein
MHGSGACVLFSACTLFNNACVTLVMVLALGATALKLLHGAQSALGYSAAGGVHRVVHGCWRHVLSRLDRQRQRSSGILRFARRRNRASMSDYSSVRVAGTMIIVCALVLLGGVDRPSLSETPPAEALDAQYRRQILGVWEDDYQGHRTMTVREDGTATMVVELQGWKARLYASRLVFDMTWSIEHGRLKKRTTGGQPSGKVKAILKLMGDRVDERILELTSERLLLLDQDGKRQYHWRRVKAKQG